MEGKCVIFEKPTYCCRLCGNGEKLTEFKEQVLCTDCIENISRTFLNLEKGEFVNMKELEEEIENLNDLFNDKNQKVKIFGKHCENMERFPILTKFIDASQNLSIQVHPDNEYAKKYENDSGKTEVW